MGTENDDAGVDQKEVEQEARKMGWRPEEEFIGDKSRWVDAETFVERGRQVIPILAQNNRKLQADLSKRDEKIVTLQEQLESAQVAIEKLEKHWTEANKRAVETAKAQLKTELKAAREDNDIDAEIAIQEKLRDLGKTNEEAPKKETPKPEKKESESDLSPEIRSWMSDNSWYGDSGDKKKTREFNRFCQDLKEDDPDMANVFGRTFLDTALELFNESKGEKSTAADKVDSGSNRGSGGNSASGGGKSWNSLPKEAKDACLADADELVGPNKRYKKLDDWKAAYAKIYNS